MEKIVFLLKALKELLVVLLDKLIMLTIPEYLLTKNNDGLLILKNISAFLEWIDFQLNQTKVTYYNVHEGKTINVSNISNKFNCLLKQKNWTIDHIKSGESTINKELSDEKSLN